MAILVVMGHPTAGSFNGAVADTVVKTLERDGHQVVFHDLYAEGFNPILTETEIPKVARLDEVLERHCTELAEAEGIVIVHPNWWGQPPAILKGWIDRVFRPGVAYEFQEKDGGEGIPIGLLRAKAAIVFNTSNTPAARELEEFEDPLETLWKNCIFGLCGVRSFHRTMFGVIVTSTSKQRSAWLDEVRVIVRRYFPSSGR
jgi:NAD(P)H dehydrogenase (quinone)